MGTLVVFARHCALRKQLKARLETNPWNHEKFLHDRFGAIHKSNEVKIDAF
jgi:hypothetical protein